MAFVYILYSKKIDKYYVGSCLKLNERIAEHNNQKYTNAYTTQANDWTVYHSFQCPTHSSALIIEKHIKKMKSRTYLENLKKYPELGQKLIKKYH